jgi:glycosyltransferase involved in cell wall biosynthesis
VGRYSQTVAPDVFRRAHVLLHTKVNDPCPTMVIEAMACGLPVAYAASGGTVELVGDDAGVGVPHDDGYDRDTPPAGDAMAEAVIRVLAERERFSAAARRRAVERFALADWLDRHEAVFAALVPQAESAPT